MKKKGKAELKLIADHEAFSPRTVEGLVGRLEDTVRGIKEKKYGEVKSYLLIIVEDKGNDSVSVHEDWGNMAFQERVAWLNVVQHRNIARIGGG